MNEAEGSEGILHGIMRSVLDGVTEKLLSEEFERVLPPFLSIGKEERGIDHVLVNELEEGGRRNEGGGIRRRRRARKNGRERGEEIRKNELRRRKKRETEKERERRGEDERRR